MIIQRKLKKILFLNEGKLVKYLLYAIGEIILVVAGILIALQVNNWNKENANRKLESQYYQSMSTQLNEDKQGLLSEINYNSQLATEFRAAIGIIGAAEIEQTERLAKATILLKNTSDFRQRSSIYESLVSSGEIKHIRSREIISKFQSLHGQYAYIERLEETHNEAMLNIIVNQVIDIVQLEPLEVKKPDLLFGYVMQNTFVLMLGVIEEKNAIYRHAIGQIEATITLLESAQGVSNKTVN